MCQYSIVIPTFNESTKILATLTQILDFMASFSKSFEVIVVDDGSHDNTAELVESYAREHKSLRLIKNPHKGKGPTIWTGVMAAKGDYIYMADTDMATPIAELKRLSSWIIEHDFDVVIASREGTGARRIAEPFYRHFMGRVFNYLVQILALPGIKDSQCGFKLFKQAVAKNVFSKLSIYGENAPEIQDAYLGAFDVEVLYLAKKLGYKIKELPVVWTYADTTRLNPLKDAYRMARDVLKVRLNDMRGVYR